MCLLISNFFLPSFVEKCSETALSCVAGGWRGEVHISMGIPGVACIRVSKSRAKKQLCREIAPLRRTLRISLGNDTEERGG